MLCRFLIILAILSLPNAAVSKTLKLDFDVHLNYFNDWSTEASDPSVAIHTTASVYFETSGPSNGDAYYWEGKLQQINTSFGRPIIVSPFLNQLSLNPSPTANDTGGFSMATNIDYGVSYPEGPYGAGPYVYYQFNDIKTGTYGSLTWDYVVGFSLDAGGIRVDEISVLTEDKMIELLNFAKDSRLRFSAGFNSRILDSVTYQALRGETYLGNAYLTNISTIPIPAGLYLFSSSLLGLVYAAVRRKKHRQRPKL